MPTEAEIQAAEKALIRQNPFLTPREMTIVMLEAAEKERESQTLRGV